MSQPVKSCVDVVKSLRENLDKVPQKDRGFAISLLAFYDRCNSLSSKQLYWADRLATEAAGVVVTPKVENVGSFQPVIDLFNKAKEHLKYPKIKLQVGDREVQLAVAGHLSKRPGTISVTDGNPFRANVWYGRVTADGTWEQNPKVPEEELQPVRRILQALSHDPAETARKYALLTGNCAFCGRPLTDAKSTAVGFGQTCAKHFGLLDQWKAAQKVVQ